jgi:L-fucose isomerase-like protein
MLRILPLASRFHSAEQVWNTTRKLGLRLETHAIPHEFVASALADPHLLFIVTGGTEHLALSALEGRNHPVLLLAHPDQNSLPASLESLCHVQQQGAKGRIILLNEAEAGWEELRRLARLLAVRDRLKTRRLGRIGAPSDWLVGSTPAPALATETWGPQVVDVPLQVLRSAMDEADAEETKRLQQDFQKGACAIREPSEHDLALAAKVAVALQQVVRDFRLDACTLRCFDLVMELQTTGCLALSALLDDGVVAGCEGDLPAALTMLWMQELSGQPAFMANPQDLDLAANTLWLAHCTIARRMLKQYALRSHFESSLGVGIQGELEPGDYTLARIGGRDLRELFVSDAELLRNGNSELRCRTQVQLRLAENAQQVLSRPLGNHHILLPGHWASALREYHDLFVATSEGCQPRVPTA